MSGRTADCLVPLCCFWMISVTSCTRSHEPLALDSYDPSHDGRTIATYHANQAKTLHKKAEDISEQAAAYERLFGPDSEWVIGARLLAQYYEEEAKEAEGSARRYRGARDDRQAPHIDLHHR
ncbi:MAG: hypothetical protein P0111_00075 [Nitrospira sp.]|nr:hypothetical protein [Nitrospira sp.]